MKTIGERDSFSALELFEFRYEYSALLETAVLWNKTDLLNQLWAVKRLTKMTTFLIMCGLHFLMQRLIN